MRLRAGVLMLGLLLLTAILSTTVPTTLAAANFTTGSTADDKLDKVFERVRQHLEKQDLDAAVQELRDAATARKGKCVECLEAISRLYYSAQKYKEASEALKETIALKPEKELELTNMLGLALYAQNKSRDQQIYNEAALAFQRVVDLSKGKAPRGYYYLGYALIRAGKEAEGLAAFKKYLAASPDPNTLTEVKAIIADPKLAFERFAPGFKVKSMSGDELSLDKFRGKIVLLDFWATWCGPCRAEMPEVKKLWQQYGSNDQFVMLGINLDGDRDALEKYLKSEGIKWPQYFDGGGWENKIAQLYGIHSIPGTVLVDENGIIRAIGLRGEELSNKIGELLKKPAQ